MLMYRAFVQKGETPDYVSHLDEHVLDEEGGSRAVLEARLLADDKRDCIGADQVLQVAHQHTLQRAHSKTPNLVPSNSRPRCSPELRY